MANPHYYRLFSAEESRMVDADTIGKFGIPGFTLMELAAAQASRHISESVSFGEEITFFCGKGNNGGDALAVARHLAESGFTVRIYFPGGTDGLSEDTGANLKLLKKIQQKGTQGVVYVEKVALPEKITSPVVVDGLFGTGLSREVEGVYRDAINLINKSGARIFSMDIPSGLNSDTGRAMGVVVKAEKTFIFGTRKTGHYTGDAFDYCGERVFCPLPFPSFLYPDSHPIRIFGLPSKPCIQYRLDALRGEKRPRHKYENGNVYIVGGSPGLTGAVVMAAKAAWRTGCGSVQVFCPPGLASAYDAHLVEQTRTILPAGHASLLSPDAVPFIADALEKRPGTLLIGPGLGRAPETLEAVHRLLSVVKVPVVADADALYALDEESRAELSPDLNLLVTPHPGEQQRMHGKHAAVPEDVRAFLSHFPNSKNLVYAAKGLPSIISTENETWVSDYDTRTFSRTGFGDVLAGLAAGYISQIPSGRLNADEMAAMLRLAMLDMAQKIPTEGALSPMDLI